MATTAQNPAPEENKPAKVTSGLFEARLSERDTAMFCRQLAVLLDAGIPMVRGLKLLGARTSGHRMRQVVTKVISDVEAGGAFSTAMQTHGEGLPGIVVPLCRAGETSGELSKNLRDLADSLDHDAHIKGKIHNAMVFPILTLGMAVTVLLFILLVLAPKFQVLLAEAGNQGSNAQVPWISQVVFSASDVVREPMGLTLVLGGLLVIIIAIWRGMTTRSYLLDFLKIRTPFIGRMVTTAAMARFGKTLGALLRTGVPVLESLQLARETVDNMAIEQAIVAMEKSVETGGRLSDPLEQFWYIPALARDMIVIGEESGSMSEMLDNLSDVFRSLVDRDQDRLVSLVEPLMTMLLGFVVLIVVLAMFLPYLTIVTGQVF